MILKMNFNFNFKDMPGAAGQSIRSVTNARDCHHTEKSGIKRNSECGQLAQRRFSPLNTRDPLRFTPCAYAEVLRSHQRRIKKVSEQRTIVQITAAYARCARIALTRAEMPKAMAIKNPKAAPIRARN